jgi:IS605 OrfB family transposase
LFFKNKRCNIFFVVKRTIAIKLNVSSKENQDFLELQDLFSSACTRVAEIAIQQKETNRTRLHHLSYYLLKEEFPTLGSQMCCNAIGKTAHALKALKKPREILFRKGVSVHFDKRTYSLKNRVLSLFTLKGRVQLQLEMSSYHADYLSQGQVKEAELVRKGKRWFFHLVLDLPEVTRSASGKTLAVDFGENNLAATSTGKLFGGAALKAQREKFLGHRRRLQSNGSQSAKQRLRQISGREKRHVTYVNHCVAKEIIHEAQRNGCTRIVLEDLKNIRLRIRANKRVRSRLHRWAFDQLRLFVDYKAAAQGIEIVYVNPAYTSVTCSCCLSQGHRIKHHFFCTSCGSRQHSDLNASQNLLRLASTAVVATGDVNHRHVAA